MRFYRNHEASEVSAVLLRMKWEDKHVWRDHSSGLQLTTMERMFNQEPASNHHLFILQLQRD